MRDFYLAYLRWYLLAALGSEVLISKYVTSRGLADLEVWSHIPTFIPVVCGIAVVTLLVKLVLYFLDMKEGYLHTSFTLQSERDKPRPKLTRSDYVYFFVYGVILSTSTGLTSFLRFTDSTYYHLPNSMFYALMVVQLFALGLLIRSIIVDRIKWRNMENAEMKSNKE